MMLKSNQTRGAVGNTDVRTFNLFSLLLVLHHCTLSQKLKKKKLLKVARKDGNRAGEMWHDMSQGR